MAHERAPEDVQAPAVEVDIGRLDSFVVLADELHFTHAAQRLHMAQPALSQQINRLEHQVGAKLFMRSSRDVVLTPAGQLLLEQVRPALRSLNSAVAKARTYTKGGAGVLSVAFLSSFLVRAESLVVSAFAKKHPDVVLNVMEFVVGEELKGLESGEIDLAFSHGYQKITANPTSVDSEVLAIGPAYLAVATDHPLATRSLLRPEELSQETFLLPPRGEVSAPYRDHFIAICNQHGFWPRMDEVANSLNSRLGLVASGMGVSVVSWLATMAPRANVAYVEIDQWTFDAVVTRPHQSSKAADDFIDVAREVLGDINVDVGDGAGG